METYSFIESNDFLRKFEKSDVNIEEQEESLLESENQLEFNDVQNISKFQQSINNLFPSGIEQFYGQWKPWK